MADWQFDEDGFLDLDVLDDVEIGFRDRRRADDFIRKGLSADLSEGWQERLIAAVTTDATEAGIRVDVDAEPEVAAVDGRRRRRRTAVLLSAAALLLVALVSYTSLVREDPEDVVLVVPPETSEPALISEAPVITGVEQANGSATLTFTAVPEATQYEARIVGSDESRLNLADTLEITLFDIAGLLQFEVRAVAGEEAGPWSDPSDPVRIVSFVVSSGDCTGENACEFTIDGLDPDLAHEIAIVSPASADASDLGYIYSPTIELNQEGESSFNYGIPCEPTDGTTPATNGTWTATLSGAEQDLSVDFDICAGSTPNAAPITQDDTATAEAGALIEVDVLANDTDPEGQPLQLVGVDVADEIAQITPDQTILARAPDGPTTIAIEYTVTDGTSESTGSLLIQALEQPSVSTTSNEVPSTSTTLGDRPPDDDPAPLSYDIAPPTIAGVRGLNAPLDECTSEAGLLSCGIFVDVVVNDDRAITINVLDNFTQAIPPDGNWGGYGRFSGAGQSASIVTGGETFIFTIYPLGEHSVYMVVPVGYPLCLDVSVGVAHEDQVFTISPSVAGPCGVVDDNGDFILTG